MKATILHDERGQILAISKTPDLQTSGSKFTKAGMIAMPGQKMLEVELSGQDEKRSLRELHEHYRVDISASTLVKK